MLPAKSPTRSPALRPAAAPPSPEAPGRPSSGPSSFTGPPSRAAPAPAPRLVFPRGDALGPRNSQPRLAAGWDLLALTLTLTLSLDLTFTLTLT